MEAAPRPSEAEQIQMQRDRSELVIQKAQFEQEKEILFSDLILDKTPLSYLVITFFALLELSRLQKLRMHQKSCYGEITCSWVSDFNT